MMKTTARVLILAIAFATTPAHAYKEPVHKRMTKAAFDRLQLDFQARLGVPRTHVINGDSLSKLMQTGANNEDLVIPFARPLNHFFDPEHGVGLTVPPAPASPGCFPVGSRADDWALTSSFNPRGLFEARLFYESAILGPNPGTRDVYLKELAITLGHLVHLVQDMAQPEHTRNDQHLDFSDLLLQNGTDPSVWEEWGLANLLPGNGNPPAVSYDGYETVRMADYASFFHTAGGRGLADFSNRSFVTQDTNYHDNRLFPNPCNSIVPSHPRCYNYAVPRIEDAAARTEVVNEHVLDVLGNPSTRLVEERIYTSFPMDEYSDRQETDVFHTFESLLDLETRRHGCRVYSLGDGSYLTRAAMLVPRAVGYSAGFVEHFFRGNLELRWEAGSAGRNLVIINRSDQAIGADARITLLYRAAPSYFQRTTSDDTMLITNHTQVADLAPGFSGLAPGGSVTIPNLNPPGLHPGDDIATFETRIVMRATLGTETNAVLAAVKPPGTSSRQSRTLHFNPAAGSAPYYNPSNFGAGQIYRIRDGALAYKHFAMSPSASGLYMNLRGGTVTFLWLAPAFEQSFRIVNGNTPMNLSVRISDNVFHDQGTFRVIPMAAFEEVVVELPENVARFTVLPSDNAFFGIDDITWEFFP